MEGEARRERLLQRLQQATAPISGTVLAESLGVSRQIIVQDIALLRAQGHSVLSTNRGYRIESLPKCSRVFAVRHTTEELEDELLTIVDLGGVAEDVFVDHKRYGRIRARLDIASRRDVAVFLQGLQQDTSPPLMRITHDHHYHTVSARSPEILDLIEESLRKKGYLDDDPYH